MSNRIQQLREENNMTQLRLSIELEVEQQLISAYELGTCYPPIESLLILSDLFDENIDYILGFSDIRKTDATK